MSGKAAAEMRRLLNATACYSLTGSTPADWELNACGAGFDLVEEELERLLGDLFAGSASGERLDAWEELYRPQPSTGTLEERRGMLRERFSLRPGRFTPDSFSPMLRAAGVEGIVEERDGGLRVVLGRLLGVPEGEARRELDRLLPAHLEWEWDPAVTWTALDAYTRPFAELEEKNYTWEQLDALTREQLEQEES